MKKPCVPESKETPSQEARSHSKKYLAQALRKKSGSQTNGSAIGGAAAGGA